MHGETVGATVAATVSDELSTLFSDFIIIIIINI